MSYPTCRRHPRTTLEAFRRTTEYASAIERTRRRDWTALGHRAVFIGGILIGAAVLVAIWMGAI